MDLCASLANFDTLGLLICDILSLILISYYNNIHNGFYFKNNFNMIFYININILSFFPSFDDLDLLTKHHYQQSTHC